MRDCCHVDVWLPHDIGTSQLLSPEPCLAAQARAISMSIILISELFIIESDWNLEKVNVVHVDNHFDCRKTVVLLQWPENPRQLWGLSCGMP